MILDLVKLTVKTAWSDTDSGELKDNVRDIYRKHMKFGHSHSPQPTDGQAPNAQSFFLLDPDSVSRKHVLRPQKLLPVFFFVPVLAYTLIITQEAQPRSSNWKESHRNSSCSQHGVGVGFSKFLLGSEKKLLFGEKVYRLENRNKTKNTWSSCDAGIHRDGKTGAWIVKAWREKPS